MWWPFMKREGSVLLQCTTSFQWRERLQLLSRLWFTVWISSAVFHHQLSLDSQTGRWCITQEVKLHSRVWSSSKTSEYFDAQTFDASSPSPACPCLLLVLLHPCKNQTNTWTSSGNTNSKGKIRSDPNLIFRFSENPLTKHQRKDRMSFKEKVVTVVYEDADGSGCLHQLSWE